MVITSLVVAVVVGVLSYYVNQMLLQNTKILKQNKKLIENQSKYDRILFGEEDVDQWKGIIALIFEMKTDIVNNKRALTGIIDKLLINEIVDKNDEDLKKLKEILDN